MKKLFSLLVLCCFSAVSFAASETVVKQLEVDHSGKPPYKRKLVEVSEARKSEATSVSSTDFSGKPPFKRNVKKHSMGVAAASAQ